MLGELRLIGGKTMDIENTEWLDSDCEEFEKYNSFPATIKDIQDFYKAKKAYLLSPNIDTSSMMKTKFQMAHSGLKAECSCHTISPHKLQELTELLKRGL